MTINDIKHAKLTKWVNEIAALTTPDAVVLADGSSEQYDKLVHFFCEGRGCRSYKQLD